MFLNTLRRRNPGFILAAQRLHQQGQIPANAYVIDFDAVTANARLIRAEGDRLGLRVFAMTKQDARQSGFAYEKIHRHRFHDSTSMLHSGRPCQSQ